jgi:hypothetical protein
MASSVLGEKVAKQLESIPSSNDTVSRRISDMASNVKEQLIVNVKASKYYSIQLDESTDVRNMANLLTFIRFEDEESAKKKKKYCFAKNCLAVLLQMTFLKKLEQFMKVHGIEWKKCVRVCSDGARAMTGNTGVRWLSQGNVLSRLYELRSEVQIFLSDTTSDLSNRLTDEM